LVSEEVHHRLADLYEFEPLNTPEYNGKSSSSWVLKSMQQPQDLRRV